ncbi:zinc dependent phospholipase C family protein [Pelosinus sp. IPA-1]|uniref:zinc dependent phospholipase C family protein n=1 Tax=Pelosinus sp. IPA-1 TaxID=3029569 RepID=UPI002436197C|nr:zinc dependent phospholipase C family protein [Pelosinus sp. IPA-1]GMB01476.1 phospholipase C [Pelosinus sp. IPA-1]
MLKGVVGTSLKAVALLENPLLQSIDSSCCTTHQYCNEQALNILQYNGFMQETVLLRNYYKQLQDGVIWADLNWKNIHHFLHPKTRRGFWHFSNAAGDYLEFFNTAIKFVRQGSMKEAIFYLGAAAHLVQDMCVPHHAKCQLFDGHKKYEIWVERHLRELSFTQYANIPMVNPVGVLLKNAETALELYNYVNADARNDQYQKATEILLPLANQSTANQFCYFFARVKKIMGVSSLEEFK